MVLCHVLAAILMASVCFGSGPFATVDDPYPLFLTIHNSLHPYIQRANEIPDLAKIDEDTLNVPRGTLTPGFVYESHLDDIIMAHVTHASTRFVALESGDHSTYFATPWKIRIPSSERMARGHRVGVSGEKQRGVLFFDLDQGGEVRPSWHAGFKDGRMEGRSETFWEYINRVATLTPDQLRRHFGELKIME